MRLNVLSYNIHKGFSAGNASFVLARIRESIRLVKADIVFLQEVLGHHDDPRRRIEDWPTRAQFEFLADKVWPHYAYGRNVVHSEGHHGNAILSRYPIVSFENIDVSTNPIEARGVLHAVVEIPEGGIAVHALCLHLGLFERSRRRQLERLAARVDAHVPHGAPLILAGDFNDWRENATDALGRALGATEAYHALHREHARTFPSWRPILRLDRIYVRDVEPVAATAMTGPPWDALSDHVALYAELEVGGAR